MKKNKTYWFFYKKIYLFFELYITNHVIVKIPSWTLRRIWLRLIGLNISSNSNIDMNCFFMSPRHIKIGTNTHINQSCFIDGRGEVTLGNNVSVSHYVKICSGSHDIMSPHFSAKHGKINIDDYCWIGIGAIILKNVTLGEGTVVAAGSVVTKSTPPYSIVGGVPAKIIGQRTTQLQYKPLFKEHHFRYM